MRTLCLVAVLAIVCASPTAATLIEVDLDGNPLAGGPAVRDTDTDLIWLDPTQTDGLSYDEVEAGAGGWTALGFRHATLDEVCLFSQTYLAGYPDPCPGIDENVADDNLQDAIVALQSFFGATNNNCAFDFFCQTIGLFDDGNGNAFQGRWSITSFSVEAEPVDARVDLDAESVTAQLAYAGHLLVREVPEPGALLYLLSGLAVLGIRTFAR